MNCISHSLWVQLSHPGLCLVPFAPCSLQSLVWLQHWTSGNSLNSTGICHESYRTLCWTGLQPLSDCRVQCTNETRNTETNDCTSCGSPLRQPLLVYQECRSAVTVCHSECALTSIAQCPPSTCPSFPCLTPCSSPCPSPCPSPCLSPCTVLRDVQLPECRNAQTS